MSQATVIDWKARAEAAEAKVSEFEKRNPISAKVSEKGAVSVYGLQRFPVTLYAGQWERLIKYIPTLSAFMDTNRPHLATK